MSEVKINEELQDDPVAADVTTDENVEETQQAADGDQVTEEAPKGPEQELAEAREQIADLQDRMLRAAAENENFKKRVERDRLASLKYAGEAIFREILPTVDNLERALDQGVVEGADAQKNLDGLVEGVQLTLKSLVATLEKFEVKAINSVGEPFDPKHQEALTMDSHDTIPENHVLTDFEKGYYYKDRLLRAAKVVVSSGKKEE
ncbi:nucleotide exchange factor GrpE [Desulforhopalus sp. 52FAK]